MSDITALQYIAEADVRIDILTKANAELREVLEEFVDCAMYDPLMEGPRFKGWNRSSLDRALVQARAALARKP